MLLIFLEDLWAIIASIVLYCTVIPCLVLITLVSKLVRFVLHIWIRQKYPRNTLKLLNSGADGCYCTLEKTSSTTALVCLRFKKEEISYTNLLNTVNLKIIIFQDKHGNYPFDKYRWILVQKFGYACWKLDEEFDVKNHIKLAGGVDKTEKDLKKYLSDISNQMDESKPQWEMILYDYNG